MFDDLLDANRRFAARFPWRGTPGQAAKQLAVVTCMDTRIDPLAVLGLQVGEAKVVRNAGGRVTGDVLRSLLLAVVFLDVRRIVVMHHTRCALAGHDDTEIRAGIPQAQREGVAQQPLLGMPDADAALATDVQGVRDGLATSPGVVVEGWRYDVDTGEVTRIVA